MTGKQELVRAISNSKLPMTEIAKRLSRCSKVNPALDRILSSENAVKQHGNKVYTGIASIADILKLPLDKLAH